MTGWCLFITQNYSWIYKTFIKLIDGKVQKWCWDLNLLGTAYSGKVFTTNFHCDGIDSQFIFDCVYFIKRTIIFSSNNQNFRGSKSGYFFCENDKGFYIKPANVSTDLNNPKLFNDIYSVLRYECESCLWEQSCIYS